MKKWFENLVISKKLSLSFVAIILLSVIVGGIGIYSIVTLHQNTTALYQEDTLGLDYAGKAGLLFMKIRYNSLKLDSTEGADEMSALVSQQREYFDMMDQYFKHLKSTLKSSEGTAQLDFLQENWGTYKTTMTAKWDKMLSTLVVSAPDQAMIATGESLLNGFTDLFTFLSTEASGTAAHSDRTASLTLLSIVIYLIVSVVLAALLGKYTSSIISNPLKKVTRIAELLSIGDISSIGKLITNSDMNLKERKDEIGTMVIAFSAMLDSNVEQTHQMQRIAEGDLTTEVSVRSERDSVSLALSKLVSNFNDLASAIVSSADQVDSGARMVADSSTALSQGATEQASSVEELTTTLEKVTAQTALNAENARKTDQLAKKIRGDAEKGSGKMTEMLGAMAEINTASDSINKIIKVIENIAFQTNILALNAAVEAARAGEHGKGFAVVAEEVRNLAAQSAKAATETAELIEGSVEKVESGTKIAQETADSLNMIVEGIAETAELIDSIAIASHEQSTALEQINTGVAQVSQVVQNNAASAEEGAAASEQLSSQASNMKAHVSIFKLRKSHALIEQLPAPIPESARSHTPVARKSSRPVIALSESEFGKY